MKFGNKGMTLVELLVTLVFVGIILVFMFTILNELRGETNNNNFAYNNQVNKVDATHAIQKDLIAYPLLGLEDKSLNNEIIINFYYLKGDEKKTAVLSTSKNNGKYYLNYKNADGEENKWEMKEAEIDNCAKFTIYNENNINETDSLSNYYFKININLYNKVYNERNNKDKNNYVDDIEVTYVGYNNYLENNASYLTSKNNGTYNIGNC